jgi:hypothetical protein
MSKVIVSINNETVELSGATAAEFEKDRALQHANFLKLQADLAETQAANATNKAALLTKLGITADEAALLLA